MAAIAVNPLSSSPNRVNATVIATAFGPSVNNHGDGDCYADGHQATHEGTSGETVAALTARAATAPALTAINAGRSAITGVTVSHPLIYFYRARRLCPSGAYGDHGRASFTGFTGYGHRYAMPSLGGIFVFTHSFRTRHQVDVDALAPGEADGPSVTPGAGCPLAMDGQRRALGDTPPSRVALRFRARGGKEAGAFTFSSCPASGSLAGGPRVHLGCRR